MTRHPIPTPALGEKKLWKNLGQTCLLVFLLHSVSALSAAAPARDEKQVALPRLTQIDAFPDEYRAAVRVVIAALSAAGAKPDEYFAIITPTKEGPLEVFLKHQSHPVDNSHWLGDACGRCLVTSYDPKTGKVSRFQGIR